MRIQNKPETKRIKVVIISKTSFIIALMVPLNVAFSLSSTIKAQQPITDARITTQYAISLDISRLATYSAWQIQGSTINHLFSTLGHNTLQSDISLSSAENNAMQTYTKANYASNTPFKSIINKSIEQIWGIDNLHVLIQTNNEICDAFSSINCFGYYEFLCSIHRLRLR